MALVTASSLPAGAAYVADRAAALAGIPKSTLHYWDRAAIWTPSVSRTKVKRWSFSDLLALRLIDWLRREDKPEAPSRVPNTSMAKIRQALGSVEHLGDRLVEESVIVSVDSRGGIVIHAGTEVFIPLRHGYAQTVASDEGLDLLRPWSLHPHIIGPDLSEPGPTLRIIPGKLSGEPHVVDTRIPTQTIWGLSHQGFDSDGIIELYPRLTPENVHDAIDLEERLARNLRHAA
jgi:uncharacterized protein (DUF433 family)